MRIIAVASILLALVATPELAAQIRASEPATVSQTVDGTTMTVEYSRPRARGRTGLFGSRIHWGEVWTPGANQSTTLSVSKDVTIEGVTVPQGKYSVWLVVQRQGSWEMVLDRNAALFHTQPPRNRAGQVRLTVRREKRPFLEVLTWWFPEVSVSGATLAMQWDTVYVTAQVRVPRSYTTDVSAEVARRIAGAYRWQLEPEPRSDDTTLIGPRESAARELQLTIRQQGKELHAVMDPPMYKTEEGYRNWILVPTRGGWFYLARTHKGELIEVLDYFQLQFNSGGERASGFEARAFNDRLLGKGTRIP